MPAAKDSSAFVRPANIEDCLKGEAQYSRESLPVLLQFLDEQLAKGSLYDAEANLAILKLYAIYPDTIEYARMNQVLIKALMNFPSTDFSLCMYQIPEHKHNEVKEVIKLATLLETAKFKQFWKEAEGVEAMKKVKDWEKKLRDEIASVVAITYRAIKAPMLAELLNLKENSKELDALIKAKEWKKDGAKVIVNPGLRSTSEQQSLADGSQGHNSVLSLDEYKRVISVTTSI